MSCRHYLVSGRVQGVFYRASTQRQASMMGLRGWVRNLCDGRVEVLACGEDGLLDAFGNWLQIGPEHAKVTKIQERTITMPDTLHGFSVLPTGDT